MGDATCCFDELAEAGGLGVVLLYVVGAGAVNFACNADLKRSAAAQTEVNNRSSEVLSILARDQVCGGLQAESVDVDFTY